MVERNKNSTVPLCVFLVVKCTNDDRLLFIYPCFGEQRVRCTSGRTLKSPCALRQTDNTWKQRSSHGLIENDQLILLDSSLMAFLFTVKPEMCNKAMLVKINDVRFIGYPISHDPSSSCPVSNGLTDPVNILRYNVVFAIRAEAPRKIIESFVTLAKEFALAIQHEENRCGYLTSQVKIMLDCFEIAQSHHSIKSVYDAVLKKSNLAQTLKQAFVDLLRTGTVSLSVNGWIEVSWNVHQRYSKCLTKPLFPDDVVVDDGMVIKPYHAVLLLESVKSITDKMKPDHSTAIIRFLNASTPVKPLLVVARELDYDLEQVFRIVQHLIYWRKALVIFPLTEANVYVVDPEADLTRTSLKKKFQRTFYSCCMGKILSSFSMPVPLSQFIARCGDNRDVAVRMVVWFLQHGFLMQLHTFVYLCCTGTEKTSVSTPKDIPFCESTRRMLRINCNLNELQFQDMLLAHRTSADPAQLELFVQLLPYFDGEHHIEEMMFFETLSRAKVMQVICDYDDMIVLSVHEDPFLERRLKPCKEDCRNIALVQLFDVFVFKRMRFVLMAELLLDPAIRTWVFLPIVLLTFLIGVVRHYVSLLISARKEVDLQQVQDSQVLIRSRLLRENGRYIPKSAFTMRRQYFNNDENGYLTLAQQRQNVMLNPMADPSMMTEMLKGNLLNVIPMLMVGGWINWTFSGFVTTKVPFPLTLRFKPMLQHGIALASLDASWVSSASWYFLNVFGLRSMYALILGEENAADQTKMMQEQMNLPASAMPQDPRHAFKAEWEALQLHSHQWAVKHADKELFVY
ncbi:hypothetical protein M513_08598 [Trichuris suis]|uniref:GATOR complex protein NPRL3 n=1 Tax=Trichuris suis TaxID=68888 RepID=A0A085LZY4_9BILA|nr:hypothetical protein M513_08598 [Trichuris suis]